MNKIKLIFLLPLLIAAGCQHIITPTEKPVQLDTTVLKRKEALSKVPISTCDSTVINNELGFNILVFDVFKANTAKIKSLFLDTVVLKLEKQKNSEGGTYDLYHFTDGVNTLTLYNNGGFYLDEGEIRNDKVLLNKKISMGMTKDDFLKLIKATNINCDTIVVKDDELTFETVYIFSDNKLKQIKMGQIVE